MSYSFCELSIKIKVPLLSVVSDCISVPNLKSKQQSIRQMLF
nr:MAG TPA: hypothetical protein [Caudoviricetes sp.]